MVLRTISGAWASSAGTVRSGGWSPVATSWRSGYAEHAHIADELFSLTAQVWTDVLGVKDLRKPSVKVEWTDAAVLSEKVSALRREKC